MSQNFKQQNMEPVPTSRLMYPVLHFQIQLIFTLKTYIKNPGIMFKITLNIIFFLCLTKFLAFSQFYL